MIMVLRRGASQERQYLGNEMIKKTSNEGKMKVIVPNETFKPDKAHHFRSFVQCIRIYTCIGNFQEDFDTKHRFDTEIQRTHLYLYME